MRYFDVIQTGITAVIVGAQAIMIGLDGRDGAGPLGALSIASAALCVFLCALPRNGKTILDVIAPRREA